jgi:hypothetical protein
VTELAAAMPRDELALYGGRRLRRTPTWPVRVVLQASDPSLLVMPRPIRGGPAGDPHGCVGSRQGRVVFDQPAEW